MTIFELNKDELNQLKSDYFWNEETQDILEDCYSCPEDIPDDIIYNHYKDVMFIKEDFWCNL